jgi:hypothetical protein
MDSPPPIPRCGHRDTDTQHVELDPAIRHLPSKAQAGLPHPSLPVAAAAWLPLPLVEWAKVCRFFSLSIRP